MKKILLLFVLAIVTLSSCRKDVDIFNPNPTTPIVNINASFKGIIVDQSGAALENVEIKIGSTITMTDAQGFFVIKNQNVQKDKAFIQASKSGFFSGSRTLYVQKDKTHNVKIMLMTDASIGTVDNATGGTVNLPNGSQVVFPVDGVAHEDGTPYTGVVYVSAQYIDPSTLDGQMSMPGDLRAIDNESRVQALTSYGMIAVELKNGAGDLLQVADNKAVELHLEIPAQGLSTATSTIPLWYFDNEQASWVEQGQAEKVGSMYVGLVRHFSFWNCDIPANYTSINLNFTDSDGNPADNLHVVLSNPDVPYSPGNGWTNNAGYVGGVIPSGVVMTMTVFNDCGALLYTEDIGPFDTEATLDFVVTDLSIYPHITGTLVGCDGMTPVTNGYVAINNNNWWSNNYYDVDENGHFDFDYSSCIINDTTIATLVGYDIDLLNQSDEQTFTLSPNVDLGNVLTCTTLEEYFNIEDASGTLFTALDPYLGVYNDSIGVDALYFGFEDLQDNYLNFNEIQINSTGAYNLSAVAYGFFTDFLWTLTPNGDTVILDINITSYPDNIGEYLIGTGTITSSSGDIYTVSFKIKRDS